VIFNLIIFLLHFLNCEVFEIITGDKNQAQSFSREEKSAEIFDIRRLAGLKV
jgi:hypothetical protein